MTDIRFDFSSVSRVKDSLRARLMEQYALARSCRQRLADDSLDYAAAAGTGTPPVKSPTKTEVLT